MIRGENSELLGRLLSGAQRYADRTAIVDLQGSHQYSELLGASEHIAATLLEKKQDLHEERIAFLVAPGFAWVALQWGIWQAGGIAVPLPLSAARPELEYLLEDAQPEILVFDETTRNVAAPLAQARGLRALSITELLADTKKFQALKTNSLPEIGANRAGMILYTSGTTSRPKGVLSTHANIAAQIRTLVEAWEWTANDRILLCLPLHHVHGIINVVSCALWSGALCRMLPRFDAETVWESIARGELTLFMAVPTIYAKLITSWEAAEPARRAELSTACKQLRLMVSGSAALPVSTLERWREISGHTLLERYGMTEIGMALSSPLKGELIPGSVGRPLPGVEVRVVDEKGDVVSEGAPGEIEVRGASVFREYWRNPEATSEAFREGWFRTGDTTVVQNGIYRILGRTSVDILKTGGHKISALEIEEVLRRHPAVAECAVVGVPDAEWGERVCAAVVVNTRRSLELAILREWAREFLAAYKLPSRLLVVDALPRNAMGKVVKPEVAKLFSGDAPSTPGERSGN